MLDDFEDASQGFQGSFCLSKGHELDQSFVRKVLSIVIESKLSLSKNQYKKMIGNRASDVFRKELESRMILDEELNKNKALVRSLFDWFLRYECIENSCDNIEEVSIASYTDWTDAGDGTLLNFKDGYRSLLHWFCSNFPSKKWIHLNKQVTNIEMLDCNQCNQSWIDEKRRKYSRPLLVRYKSGKKDADIGTIECNHVIVTVSLGYLKKNHETLFKPPLPPTKIKLIDSIGFGTVNKIILQFEKPFWNNNPGFKLVWEEEDRKMFAHWAHDIIAFDVVRRQPNLLMGWIGGRGASLMEQENDAEIAKTCIKVLDHFLPLNYNKPTRLMGCICSRWNSNPYTCGSYSFQSMKSFNQNVDRLHEPIWNNNSGKSTFGSSVLRVPRVLFAGEATGGRLYSTTHGAVITGWREADRLKDYMLDNKMTDNDQQVETSDRIPLNMI